MLSARMGFGSVVDAILAERGEYNQSPKWRARCVRSTAPDVLPLDRYWSVETVRDLDPRAPAGWVGAVTALCRELAAKVMV